MRLLWPLPDGIPISRGSDEHLAAGQGEGVDFACWTGTAWLSCAPVQARVVQVGYDAECGNRLWLQWYDGPSDRIYRVRYCHGHLPAPFGVGALVEPGEEIGFVGSTGKATGSHLHLALESWTGNPEDYWERLRPEDYLGGTVTADERTEALALLDLLYGISRVLASEQTAPDTLASLGEQGKNAVLRLKELVQ